MGNVTNQHARQAPQIAGHVEIILALEEMYPHIETMRKLLSDGRLTAHLQ